MRRSVLIRDGMIFSNQVTMAPRWPRESIRRRGRERTVRVRGRNPELRGVLDMREIQPLRRRGDAAPAPIAGLQHLGDPLPGPPAGAHRDQRPGDVADHVVQERVGAHGDNHGCLAALDGDVHHPAHRRGGLAFRRAERREVMLAEEDLRGRVHAHPRRATGAPSMPVPRRSAGRQDWFTIR